MAAKPAWKPWHEVVSLRDDLKTGELSLAVFAADLFDVVMQKGRRPVYEDPARFFALTYPTRNLRDLVKGVVLRLAGRSDKAYRKLSINYGGGKTHTLITLRHLVDNPDALPDLPAVHEFQADIGFPIPRARVAALCFDKIDVEKGVETRAPDGTIRMLKYPWSILAFQLVGPDGLKALHGEGRDEERDTPPAEPLMVDLLSRPQAEGLATLVLIDEVLMYVRAKVEADPNWRGRLVSFFQYLTQAVVKVDRCAMLASLLASDPRKEDDLGRSLLGDIADVFSRQMEETANPVEKDDVAEVLRRRFFTPESIREPDAFRPHVITAVANIAALDENTRKERSKAEQRYLASYPFHPELTDVFYTRWTQIEGFQKARGILRTFAIALRDAEKWDSGPLVGPNVFLAAPGRDDLSEAARELCGVASTEAAEGRRQNWDTILQGELSKARQIETEATGLKHREIEQAVFATFLSSQPIGQRALTSELIVLASPTKPDRIELEKALKRWTEISWFLDEVEVGKAEQNQLPKTWRLGNRPNLRQMHHDACQNRVRPELIEAHLIDVIGKVKALTAGASAAGAKVHTLPEKPSDIEDDGEFHFAVLGPKGASDSGKPSAEARRFIDETTSADRERFFRNAIVLVVPSRDGLDAARTRVREYLGWIDVSDQLKDQEIDPLRQQMLSTETGAAKSRIPEAIKQAYSVVVAVCETNDVQAFKVTITDEPLFTIVKADKRARIQETAISAEAILPGGPYDLWHPGEQSRRVKDLVGAFAQFPRLPKMLRRKEILDTVVQGVLEGIWGAQVTRPDRSVRTFWRTAIDESALKDPGLEVFLPQHATLAELPAELLGYQTLPGLWAGDEIGVQDVFDYFAGGHTVTVPREGWDETVVIPTCGRQVVETAISQAVERGLLWLTNGPASIWQESVPQGVLNASARLSPPPLLFAVSDLMAEAIPDAWRDGTTNALALATALSTQRGKSLPWAAVRSAIDSAIKSRWLELAAESGSWPCDFAAAQYIVLKVPAKTGLEEKKEKRREGVLVAEASLAANAIQDLADVIPDLTRAAVGHDLKFHVRVEIGGEKHPESTVVAAINDLLSQVSEAMKLA